MKKFIFTFCVLIIMSALTSMTRGQSLEPQQDSRKGTYGYVDASGKWVVKPKYREARQFKRLPSGVEAAYVRENEKEGYLNSLGKPLGAGVVFTRIDSISTTAAIVMVKDKYGVVDWNMNYILKPVYTSISHLYGPHYKITSKDKVGLMIDNGTMLLPLKYSEIEKGDSTWYKLTEKNKVGYFDVASERIILPPAYYDMRKKIKLSTGEYFPASNGPGASWGLVDGNGKKVLDFVYQDLEPVMDRNFIILTLKDGDHQVFLPAINKIYKYTPEREWDVDGFRLVKGKIDAPDAGSSSASKGMRYYTAVYTPDGKSVSSYCNPKVEKLKTRCNRYIVQTDTAQYDLYDENYSLLISGLHGQPNNILQPDWTIFDNYSIDSSGTIYPSVTDSDYVTVQTKDKKWHYLTDGNIAADGYDEIRIINKSLHRVANNGKYGLICEDKMIVPCIADKGFQFFPQMEDGIAVTIDGKVGLISYDGETIVAPGVYDEICGTEVNLLQVKKDGKVGLMSSDGTIYVPVVFDEAWTGDGCFWVKNNSKYGVYGFDGQEILAPQFDHIYSSTDDNGEETFELWWTQKGDKYGALTPDGRQIVPAIFATGDISLESGILKVTDPQNRRTSYYRTDGTKLAAKREIKLTKFNMNHNIYDKNGVKAFRINFDFEADFLNVDGEQVYIIAKVYTANGQRAKKANGQPIELGYWVQPKYISTLFSNQWMTFPYTQFSQGKGRKEYYVLLTFQDESGRTLPVTGNNKINFYLTR